VVDDDPSIRRALRRLLASAGLEARLFASAEEFLESSIPDTAACVIVDVRMPGMSGLELQRALHEVGNPVAVILITGYADDLARRRGLEAGAIGFLSKPFDNQDLLDAVTRALARPEAGGLSS
jgi:FixJ family two-component response regulator